MARHAIFTSSPACPAFVVWYASTVVRGQAIKTPLQILTVIRKSSSKNRKLFWIALLLIYSFLPAHIAWSSEEEPPPAGGISANPGATNVLAGTGLLGRALGLSPDSGVRLGGLWLGDSNYLFAGGA